ncbi:hypothetical protein MYX76_10565 [Desulfobacterota bacterium AH_259_B03_O07]|nr:hypothetical protein [Desulfobacterota bacterium AH_259_B03_O07]
MNKIEKRLAMIENKISESQNANNDRSEYIKLIESDLPFAEKLAFAVNKGWVDFPSMVISSWEKMNKVK